MKRFFFVYILGILILSCESTDFHPPNHVEVLILNELDERDCCFGEERGDLKWVSDSIVKDSIYYQFDILCFTPGGRGGSNFMNYKYVAVYHADSINDLRVFWSDLGWYSLYPLKFDISQRRYWKEPELLMTNEFSFKDSSSVKTIGYSQILYSNEVKLKINELMELECDTLIWSPYHDCYFTKGKLIFIKYEDGDTAMMISGSEAEFSYDFSSYKINDIRSAISKNN